MKNYVEDKKFTTITLENGKTVKAETAYLHKIMEGLDVDMEEAVEIWLEDEGYEINEEQEALDRKANAKENKVRPDVGAKKRTEPVVRTVKENPTKEMIIAKIAEALQGVAANLKIENKSKIITFKIEDEEYKIDLTQKRKKKEGNK